MRLLSDLRAASRSDALGHRARLARLVATAPLRRRLATATACLADALTVMQRPYVALSGGKDSALVLALAAPLARARGRPLVAMWSDDELEYDEQYPYVTGLCAALGVPLWIVSSRAVHGGWFRTWTETPPWRPRWPDTRDTEQVADAAMRGWGFDGCLLGLRATEARGRRLNAARRGTLYQRADGLWHAQPLAWWSVEEVWAVLMNRGVPTNPVYDRLAALGVALDHQRVGPLPLVPGSQLRAGWPSLYGRLVARYGPRWS